MGLRPAAVKARKDTPIENAPEPVNQRKRAEERFWLQVDRQTKKSFTTMEAAEEMGEVIKAAHPIVQVSVYDSVDCINKLIGQDEAPKAVSAD